MKRLLLLFLIGLLTGYYYLHTIPPEIYPFMQTMHQGIIDHTANSPYRYRLLAAWLTDPFTGDRSGASIAIAYILLHFAVFPILFITLDAWLRRWLKPLHALVGVLAVAAALPLMFWQIWGISLYSALEVILLCLGLLLIANRPRQWTLALCIVILLATLNRETALLLPLAYIFTAWREPDWWRRSAFFTASWAVVFVVLRVWLGNAPDEISPAVTWAQNTGGGWWTQEALLNFCFFLPFVIGYGQGFRQAPPFLRRLLPVLVVYAGLFALFALWRESRLLLPMLVLMLPVALPCLSDGNRAAPQGVDAEDQQQAIG